MTTVKSIVAAFELARERREMERRRQRVDELFSTTSVGSATTAPAPLASHSSSAFSTTPSAPTSTTSTSIATATLSSTATRELLHPLPARCLTPGRSHGECAISHVESLTVAVRAFASKPSTTTIDAQLEFNAMEQRYTTNLAHTDSRAVVLLGEARDVHNAHMVFDKMTNQKVMNLWPLHLDEFDRKQWPPPIQLEIIDSGVILRPIPWPSFTSDTVVTGSSFSTLFSDIYGWYLHHWFEFAIKCCAMEWDITWPDCILIDVQAVMEKIMTDHMSGHQMCDGILLTNNCEFSMQRCKKHLEFLDTALLLEGNGRVQTTGILCLHPLRVCHTLLTTLIQHSVTGDEVDAQLEPPWPPTLQFKVQVYGVQLRPTFWSSFIFHTVWQLEKAPSRSWHIVQFERLYPGDRMRLHCEAESLVVAFQLLNSISVLCVTVTIEVQLIWCCQMNIQFKIPWVSLYCSEYKLHCHMFSQYPQQHAICAFNYLHGHCIEGIHGQAIVQSNPSTIQRWQHWLTLLDSTVQVCEFNKKPTVDLPSSSHVAIPYYQTCHLVPQVEDIVVLSIKSVLMFFMCCPNGVIVNRFVLLILHHSFEYDDELAIARSRKYQNLLGLHIFPWHLLPVIRNRMPLNVQNSCPLVLTDYWRSVELCKLPGPPPILVCLIGMWLTGATIPSKRPVLFHCYPSEIQAGFQWSNTEYQSGFTYMQPTGIILTAYGILFILLTTDSAQVYWFMRLWLFCTVSVTRTEVLCGHCTGQPQKSPITRLPKESHKYKIISSEGFCELGIEKLFKTSSLEQLQQMT